RFGRAFLSRGDERGATQALREVAARAWIGATKMRARTPQPFGLRVKLKAATQSLLPLAWPAAWKTIIRLSALFRDGDLELLEHPLRQLDQPPAYDTMDGRREAEIQTETPPDLVAMPARPPNRPGSRGGS